MAAYLAAVEQKIADLQRLAEELRRISSRCPGGTVAACRIIEALAPGLAPAQLTTMAYKAYGLQSRTKISPVPLAGEVEIDAVYIVAGHKGQPAAVAKRGGSDAVAGWRERRAAARWRRTSRPSSA